MPSPKPYVRGGLSSKLINYIEYEIEHINPALKMIIDSFIVGRQLSGTHNIQDFLCSDSAK